MIKMLKSTLLILCVLSFHLAVWASPLEKVNFRFQLEDDLEFVSVWVNRPSNPIRVELERAVQLRSGERVLDEKLFEGSISSIWRLNQNEFLVLISSEMLYNIGIEGGKIIELGSSKVSPFGSPQFVTDIKKNLIFQLWEVVVFYDSYDSKKGYRLHIRDGEVEKTYNIGDVYSNLVDNPTFVYPPHNSIIIYIDYLLVLDRRLPQVLAINLESKKEIRKELKGGRFYRWVQKYQKPTLEMISDTGATSRVNLDDFLIKLR